MSNAHNYYRWGICILVGFIFSLYYNGIQPLSNDETVIKVGNDRLQHMIGANYYIKSDWSFPVFSIEKLHYPEGTNLVYTDGIPVVGLFFKLLYNLTGIHYNYISFWVSLCFIFNSLCMGLILKALNIRSIFVIFASTVFCCNLYIMIERYEHAALCGQFIILISIWAYIIAKKISIIKTSIIFISIILISLLIHVYLWAMVMSLYLAWIINSVINNSYNIRSALLQFSIALFFCLAVMIISGHITLGDKLPRSSDGYNYFSMNVLSPIWPTKSMFFPHIPPLDATGGQYEGYSYMGIALLILISICVATNTKAILIKAKTNFGLLIVAIGLFIYSVSEHIYLGNDLLVKYNIPFADFLHKNFRVGGRFIWPIIYLLLIVSIYFFNYRFKNNKYMNLLLITLSLLQPIEFAKSSFFYKNSDVDIHRLRYNQVFENFLSNFDEVHFIPYYDCYDNKYNNDILNKSYLTSKHNIKVNTAYLARSKRNCEIDYSVLYNAINSNRNILFIIYKDFFHKEKNLYFLNQFIFHEDHIAYYITNTEITYSEIFNYIYPINTKKEDGLRINYIYSLSKSAITDGYAIYPLRGFSAPEDWGMWTESTNATLLLKTIPEITAKHLFLRLRSWAFVNQQQTELIVRIYVNDVEKAPLLFKWPLPESLSETTIDLGIQNSTSIKIDLVFDSLQSPKSLGLSDESRLLGLGIHTLELLTNE